jgi:LruC domain-containing protein
VVFNNAFDVIPQVPGQYINTVPDEPYHEPVLITLDLVLSEAQNPNSFNYLPPYNPFIYRVNNRGLEIHLADYPPTGSMNTALFNTVNDTSNPALGRYFKSIENLPWALHIAEEFDHQIERSQITRAYNYFKDWAQSSGTSYPDWYQDLPGYRNEEYIYHTP